MDRTKGASFMPAKFGSFGTLIPDNTLKLRCRKGDPKGRTAIARLALDRKLFETNRANPQIAVRRAICNSVSAARSLDQADLGLVNVRYSTPMRVHAKRRLASRALLVVFPIGVGVACATGVEPEGAGTANAGAGSTGKGGSAGGGRGGSGAFGSGGTTSGAGGTSGIGGASGVGGTGVGGSNGAGGSPFDGSGGIGAADASGGTGGSRPPPIDAAVGDLTVLYKTADTNATNNEIKPHLKITNKTSAPVQLIDVKVRYYYTIDRGAVGTEVLECDYAFIGNSNVKGSFAASGGTNPLADTYAEIFFTGGTIPANGDSGEIQVRIHSTTFALYNEANDYSFDPAKTAFAESAFLTLHYNGTLVWGAAP